MAARTWPDWRPDPVADAGVKIQGADQLARTLDSAAAQLDDLSAANRQAGAIVAAEAQGRAPRRTGTLAGSIRVADVGPRSAGVTAGVRYAGFQEFGTRYVTPKYFLTSALGESDRVLDPYYEAADDALATVRGI
jgi:HK97 gp10 family phage protein